MKRIFGAILGLFLSTGAFAQYLTPAVNSNLFPSTPSAGQFPIGQSSTTADWKSMSADATLGATGALTLATVNGNVGSFGSATQCVVFTTNGKGLITAASVVTCTPALASITGLGADVATALGNGTNTSGGIVTPTLTRAGDIIYWNGSAWVTVAGNNSGTAMLTENASGAPSFSQNWPLSQVSQASGAISGSNANVMLFDAGAGQSNTLPSVSTNALKTYFFKHQQTGIWTINTGAANGGIYGAWGQNQSSILLFNLGDVVGLQSDGGNWHVVSGTAPQMGAQRNEVTVQRLANPSFEVTRWGAFGAHGELLCDTGAAGATTTTACLTEAGNAAMPYILNAAPAGYDLRIVGGMDPAPPANGWYSGGPVLIPLTTGWHTPAIQGGRIWGYGLTFTCTIFVNSLEFSTMDFSGSQFSPCAGGDARNGVVIDTPQPSPLDHIAAVGPSTLFFQSPLGGFKITGGMMQNSNLHIGEQNVAAVFTTGCVYDSDTASTANLEFNKTWIDFLHGFNTAGMTAMCIGHAFESGGLVNGWNEYWVGMGPDIASVAVNGIDTWGHDDKLHITAGNMNSANYILKFEAGSCGNIADIRIQGTAPTTIVNDSGACSGIRANWVTITSTPYFPPGTVAATCVPGIGFEGFPTTGFATSSGNFIACETGAIAMDWTTTGPRIPAGQVYGISSATNNAAAADTGLSRDSAGVVDIGNGTAGDATGSLRLASLILKGTVPVGTTGSCVASSFVGGATAGKFAAAVCAGGTIILSSLPAAPNGYTCSAQDQTTPADTLKQTANTVTSATFTATTVAADVVTFSCLGW